MDVVRPVFTMRFVQLHPIFKQKTIREVRRSVYFRNEKTLEKETEKERPKRKDPKVPVRQDSQIFRYATFSEGAMPKGIRMRLLASTRMLTHPKVDANGRILVCSSTQAKPVNTTVVMQLLPFIWRGAKDLNCVLKDRQGDTFSAPPILKKIAWPPTKKQFRVRYCRNAERRFRARERKGPSLSIYQWRRRNDRNSNAPTNLHPQWTQHCDEDSRIAAWRPHKHNYTIRGTYQKTRPSISTARRDPQ